MTHKKVQNINKKSGEGFSTFFMNILHFLMSHKTVESIVEFLMSIFECFMTHKKVQNINKKSDFEKNSFLSNRGLNYLVINSLHFIIILCFCIFLKNTNPKRVYLFLLKCL